MLKVVFARLGACRSKTGSGFNPRRITMAQRLNEVSQFMGECVGREVYTLGVCDLGAW